MIKRFQAVNFKGLEMPGLELGPVNVVIGPNNCGKSNLFSAISFLFDLFGRPEEARGTLEAALMRRRSGPLVTRGKGQTASLAWTLEGELDYALTLEESTQDSVQIRGEHLAGKLPPNPFTTFWASLDSEGELTWNQDAPLEGNHHPTERLKVQHPRSAPALVRNLFRRKEAPRQGEALTREGEDSYLGIVLWEAEQRLEQLSGASLRLALAALAPADVASPKSAARTPWLDERATNFVNLLHLWLQRPSAAERLTSECGALLHGLQGIEVAEGGGYRWVRVQVDGAWRNLSEMSDGTITMLMLAALLFMSSDGACLMLDEPELNLHPAWARVVATWLLRQSAWRQIFISTHSPELLDPLTEHFQRGEVRLFVFQRTERGFRVEPCTPERVASRIAEGWQLGDLYRVGEPELGGWPW